MKVGDQDDEWNREYQLESDVEDSEEEEVVGTELKNSEEIKDQDRLKQVQDNMNVMCGRSSVDEDNAPLTELVKQKVDPELEKTIKLLKTEPKKALRTLGDTITEAKKIHFETKEGRFTTELHAACTAVIPKLSREFKKLENFVINGKEDDIAAMAVGLMKVYKEFNEMNDFNSKLVTKKGAKKS